MAIHDVDVQPATPTERRELMPSFNLKSPSAPASPRPSGFSEFPAADFPSSLISRGREQSDLTRMLEQARNDRSSVVVLRGEPGTGKSALLEIAISQATDMHLVELRGVAGLERATPAHWPGPLSRLINRQREVLAEHQPSGISPERQEMLANECAEVLEAMVHDAAGPVLLAIDDCQLLPRWLPAALCAAVTSRTSTPGLALLLAWCDIPHMESGSLWRSDVSEHVLEGLQTPSLCARLLQQHGYRDVPPALLSWLYRQTRGNPFCLVDGFSRLSDRQRADCEPRPPVVPMDLHVARTFASCVVDFPAVNQPALGIVAASQIEITAYPDVLAELGIDPDALALPLDRGVVVRRGERIEFTHPLVGAAVYHLLPEETRTTIHRVLSRYLSQQGAVERSAYHAASGWSRPNEVVSGLFQAASQIAQDRRDTHDAAQFQELSASFASGDGSTAIKLTTASELWLTAAQPDRAAQCAEAASALPVAGPFRAKVLAQQARVLLFRSVGTSVSELFEAALRSSDGTDPVATVLAHLDAASCHLMAGRYGEALNESTLAQADVASLTSQLEALVRALHGVTQLFAGIAVDPVSDIANPISQIMGKSQRSYPTPHVAFVLGIGTAIAGFLELGEQWAKWIGHGANSGGNRALRAVPPLIEAFCSSLAGSYATSGERALEAESLSEGAGLFTLSSRAAALSGLNQMITLETSGALQHSAMVLGFPEEVGPLPRLQAQITLAGLELQAGRSSVAVTWLRGAMETVLSAPSPGLDFVVLVAPFLGTMLALTRATEDVRRLRHVLESSFGLLSHLAPTAAFFEALCESDTELSVQSLLRVGSTPGASSSIRAYAELCAGAKLKFETNDQQADTHLDRARQSFEAMGATGLAALTDQYLSVNSLSIPPITSPLGDGVAPFDSVTDAAEWDISLLGGFAVRYRGVTRDIPQSFAAQTIKIVALHKRVHVDELVEMLWPESEPGVGRRRLRNVLWRIRGACGDVLRRDGDMIRLAENTNIDVAAFENLTNRALTADDTPAEIQRLASESLSLYKGELLPGDRYADWAAGFREAASRRHAQILDLLVTLALAEGRHDQALAFLELLIATDPFEEHYYLQVAEIYVESGRAQRARSALERAGRMLADLGVPPSRKLSRALEALPTR